jgi:predicted RNA binding protein YcfA (HicA-like mRNA interferase family)
LPPKIPSLSSRKFVRLLEKHGAYFVRQRGTSHAIYERVTEGITRRAPVVMGKSELSPKYIKLVLRQLGFSDEEIGGMFKR